MKINSIEKIKTDIINEVKASPDLVKKRLDICNNCPSKKIVASVNVCSECGCFLKIKTTINISSCPLNKW